VIRTANIDDAQRVISRWQGDVSSVEHIGDRGNSVFSFRDPEGNVQILRFTDPDFRSFAELAAELDFVNHLYDAGVPVARALPTTDNKFAFVEECASGDLICSSVAYAPGLEVQEDSPHWNRHFFLEWGRNLALIHQAASAYRPDESKPKRWQWEDEILIARAEQLIPREDKKSLEELQGIVGRCKALSKPASEFGLIHADHAPQNFRFDPEKKRITAFDFGNCCYHWFVSDLAISLSTVRRKPNREQIRENILEGYFSIRSLPPNLDELIDLFIRLRVIYVYLSRLHLWSENRTPEQTEQIETFRKSVHAQTGWTGADDRVRKI